MGMYERRAQRVHAAVVCPGGVPHERLSSQPEGGNPVTESLDDAGRRGANGRVQLPEVPTRLGGKDAK